MKGIALYKQIQNDIKDLIEKKVLREGDRVLSEKELAAKYNVSQITSKNALIGLVEEGYLIRIQGKGTFVKGKSIHEKVIEGSPKAEKLERKTIGFIMPTMKTSVDQRFLDCIEKHLDQAGYDLMIRITRESQEEESKAIQNFLEKGVEGFIIFPVEKPTYNNSILRLSLEKTPLVLIDRFLKEIRTYSVSSNNLNGTFGAVSDLLERGHRSVALISPEITNTVTDDRSKGFEKAFLQHNISIDKNLWCLLSLKNIADGKAFETIYEFLKERPGISAIFTMNTELARYTYDALKKLSRKIPDDVELVTFDPPRIEHVSYIQQDEDEMCRITVELLHEQLNGKYNPRKIEVPVSYMKNNQSTGLQLNIK